MPIRIPDDLPAKKQLESENIFVMTEKRAMKQDIRPLKVCILNLMPLKEETELQLLRLRQFRGLLYQKYFYFLYIYIYNIFYARGSVFPQRRKNEKAFSYTFTRSFVCAGPYCKCKRGIA